MKHFLKVYKYIGMSLSLFCSQVYSTIFISMIKSWFDFENLDVILIDSWIKYFQLLDIHVFVIRTKYSRMDQVNFAEDSL